MSIKTKVVQIEADWLLVTFNGPKPEPAVRAFWLKRTLTDWLADHPHRRVHTTLPILRDGVLIGVNVWLDSLGNPSKRKVLPRVHSSLRSLHKEYLEAILQQSYRIFFERGGPSVLAVVNRRGIAVVFRRNSQRVEVIPADKLRLDNQARSAMEEWLAAPPADFLVIETPHKEPPE